MNLLEHYIIEIHSTKPIEIPQLLNSAYVEVYLKYNCHGYTGEIKRLFTKEEWDIAIEKGYYLA